MGVWVQVRKGQQKGKGDVGVAGRKGVVVSFGLFFNVQHCSFSFVGFWTPECAWRFTDKTEFKR
jgi:hypothetical protein